MALNVGGLAPTAMSAANETAVAAFLDRRIGFLDIAATVAETLERMDRNEGLNGGANADGALEIAMDADRTARRVAADVLTQREPSL
jgi:1-deoxy-D-xylulose-5-phosphate reductoisomerase